MRDFRALLESSITIKGFAAEGRSDVNFLIGRNDEAASIAGHA